MSSEPGAVVYSLQFKHAGERGRLLQAGAHLGLHNMFQASLGSIETLWSQTINNNDDDNKLNQRRPAHSDFGIYGFLEPIPYGYQRITRFAKFT